MPENNSEPRDGLQSYLLISAFAREAKKGLDDGDNVYVDEALNDILFVSDFVIKWLEDRRKVAADANK